MLKTACDYLVTSPDGKYVDGTLGGGGHTGEILLRLNERGKLFSFDKDEEAISHCKTKFADELAKGEQSRLRLFNECFSKACSMTELRGELRGILLDLGVSSRQLDDSSRGFSYRGNAPVNLRFASAGKTAEEILNAASKDEIEHILRNFGEEPFAREIARRIVNVRRLSPIKFTFQLRTIVEESVPFKQKTNSLSRVFQALRIAVNNELEVLGDSLDCFPSLLAKGGRIVVISYHSLEDRIVKSKFKEFSKSQRTIYSDDNIEIANTMPILKILTPKPITPAREEILVNPRSRSAKLRVAEKL